MAFESMYLEEDIHIDRIYTIHYFEYKSDFHFAGERHNFWEFQCVDKGKAEIETDNGIYHLTSGQLIFHRPNEFHNLIAIGNTAPNIVVVSFECDSPCMKFFEKKLLKLSDSERNLMGMLIAEARRCIKTPLDDPYTEKMEKKEDFLFGSQQLIRIYLKRVIAYMEDHIRENITLCDLCHDNMIGRSQLQKIFQEQHQCGAMDFFSRLKIAYARQLIRENQMNFTQISEFLGYSSIHYFSRQFKKISGMTPTEYITSIKALSERERQ